MNSRILKKLSKKAMPLLEQLGCLKGMQTGVTDGFDSSWQLAKCDRKHLKRFRGKSRDWVREFAGTPWVGHNDSYSGEWDDRSAWQYLNDIISGANMTDGWDGEGDWPPCRFKLRNPSDVFWFARLLLTEQLCKTGA